MLNVRNVCTIYSVAHLYSLRSLCDVCLNFADKHAPEVIATQVRTIRSKECCHILGLYIYRSLYMLHYFDFLNISVGFS